MTGPMQTLAAALADGTKERDPLYFFGDGAADELPALTERVHCPRETALAVAAGAALALAGRPVIAVGGDGDLYGAQLGELLHLCRRNVNLTAVVADNGLTTARSATVGARAYPIRPQELALAAGATFVAQGFLGDKIHLARLIDEAVAHPGFSLVNVFMKDSDFYAKQEVNLDGSAGYDKHDREAAMARAMDAAGFYTGILYHNPDRPGVRGARLSGEPDESEWQTLRSVQ